MIATCRAIITLAFLAVLAMSPALAQKTKSQLSSEFSTNLPDNSVGTITPAVMRGVLNDMTESWQQYGGVNAQTGATYTIQLSDYGQLVTFNNSSSVAVSLPQATGSFATFNVYTSNLGAGTVTITPTTSTINGQSSLTLATGQTAWIVSDGTNYQLFQGVTGTVVTPAGIQTLTNKTFNCANNTCTVRLNTSDVTGNLPLANIATGTSDTVLGYWGSALVSAIAINNCSNALTYSTSTHTFGCNTIAGTGTVTSVGSGYGLNGGPITSSGTLVVSLSGTNNSLASDVTLNSSTYTDGPSVAQGTTGTWLATGNVTITDTTASNPSCKLWDGTTVIDSTKMEVPTNAFADFHLSGYLSSPAAGIRISCIGTDNTATMKFNASGNSKDSTISVVRIQ